MLEISRGVYDDGELPRAEDPRQAERQLGTPDAAAERNMASLNDAPLT